jgi:peptidoglycan biosynthesis protein MviN/MurJ (putative lipid II flippase)
MWLALSQVHRPTSWWLEHGVMDRVGWLAVSIAAGVGVYFVVLFVLGMRTSDFRLRQS